MIAKKFAIEDIQLCYLTMDDFMDKIQRHSNYPMAKIRNSARSKIKLIGVKRS